MPRLSLKHLTSAIVVLGLTLATSFSAQPLSAKTFDDQEKAAIKQLVKEYLLEKPEIIREALQELEIRAAKEEKQRQKKLVTENQELLLNEKYSYITGNPKADVTVVEFFDYNCPYCRQSLSDIVKLLDEDKNIRVVLKEYPILGEASQQASLAAIAARKQNKYMEYHKALLSAKGRINKATIIAVAEKVGLDTKKLEKDMASKEVKEELQKNIEVGVKLGINGTPTFIFNDQVIPQVLPYDAMKELIAKIRKSS